MAKFELGDSKVVVIIGSGAGGGTLANELASKGVDVVVLEAGKRYTIPAPRRLAACGAAGTRGALGCAGGAGDVPARHAVDAHLRVGGARLP